MLAELVAQIFPFVELVDLKLVLLCQLSYFLYNVVIFFAQRGYVFIMDTVILDILPK